MALDTGDAWRECNDGDHMDEQEGAQWRLFGQYAQEVG